VKARHLCWIPAVLAMLGCDAASPDAVVRLRQIFAERPAVADADNAFLDVFGFAATAGIDPHELGARRIAWLDKLNVDPKSAGTDPGIPGLRMNDHRSQALEQVIDACRAAIARACGSALDRVRGDAVLTDIEPLLLARYDVLLGRTGWRETETPFAQTTLPSFEGAMEAQRLMLIRLRNAAAAGDVEKIRATLNRDLTFWRMVLTSSDFLLSKMIALAAIRQHFGLGSYVLHELPPERVVAAIPAQWRVEFSDAERSLLRPMAGELILAEQMLKVGYQEDDSAQAPLDRLVDRIATRKTRQPRISEVADYFLAAAQDFQAPLTEYEAVSAKLRSKFERSDVEWDISQYALRVGSAEGMRRAALLTAELRGQSVPVAGLAQKLAESPLRNPYNAKPFEWDAADQAIVFIGPESRKYKRQAYPY
jgi:hypothetical protein